MKRLLSLIFAIFLIISICPKGVLHSYADTKTDLDKIIEENLDKLDFSEIEDYLKNTNTDFNKSFSDYIKEIISGEFSLDFSSIFSYLTGLLTEKISSVLPRFISVIAIALLYKFIAEIGAPIDEIKDVVYYACVGSIVIILFSAVTECFNSAQKTIENCNTIIQIISPVLLTLMVACGETVSVGIFNPAIIFYGSLTTSLILQTIFPLIKMILILSLLSGISPELKLNGFILFFSNLIKWILGISFTVFSLYLSLQGILGGNIDGVSIRATKYAISNSIPIIGGYVSGGFNIVVAGSVLIKNAVGIGGIVVLFFSVISPLFFIIATQLIIKLLSAIISVVSDEKISTVCNNLSKGLSLVIASIVGVCFIFIIFVLIIICFGGAFI